LIVGSGASLVAVAAVAMLILGVSPVLRFPWYIRKDRLKALLAFGPAVVVATATPVRGILLQYTLQKQNTLSYIHRTAADLFALGLAAKTHWLGVGLGSNRPSSLICSLLSTTGLIGTILFLAMCARLVTNVSGKEGWVRWAVLGALINMALAIPDVTTPVLWVALALTIVLSRSCTGGAASDAGASRARWST
jgi:hypothetical protein